MVFKRCRLISRLFSKLTNSNFCVSIIQCQNMVSLNGEALDVIIKNFIAKCAMALSKSLSKRFRFVRDATFTDFMVLPSVATLLDLRHN
jgi:hypothetical protein